MSRPLSKHPKHRREYVIMCIDQHFHARKFFLRTGYKYLLLREYQKKYPDYDIFIYVFSGRIISDLQ